MIVAGLQPPGVKSPHMRVPRTVVRYGNVERGMTDTGKTAVGRTRAWCSQSVHAGATRYDRIKDLPLLIPIETSALCVVDRCQHAALLALLRRALRAERSRGIAGHWTYDLSRHEGLLRAYREECAAFEVRRDEATALVRK